MKIQKAYKILIGSTLVFLSLLALHDIIYGWGEEPLIHEFLILGTTLIYFFWLKKFSPKLKSGKN